MSAHGRAGYEFAHGLLREHLLAGLPALRRQRLHAKVADVLSADQSPDDALSRRAQHLVAALPLVEPARWSSTRAGWRPNRPTGQWSSEIAARWWRAALDAYDLLPAAQRADSDRDALTVALLEALARAGRGQTVLDTVAHCAGRGAAVGPGGHGRPGRRCTAAGQRRMAVVGAGADPGELLELLLACGRSRRRRPCRGGAGAAPRWPSGTAITRTRRWRRDSWPPRPNSRRPPGMPTSSPTR